MKEFPAISVVVPLAALPEVVGVGPPPGVVVGEVGLGCVDMLDEEEPVD